jgi:hypothetical protein
MTHQITRFLLFNWSEFPRWPLSYCHLLLVRSSFITPPYTPICFRCLLRLLPKSQNFGHASMHSGAKRRLLERSATQCQSLDSPRPYAWRGLARTAEQHVKPACYCCWNLLESWLSRREQAIREQHSHTPATDWLFQHFQRDILLWDLDWRALRADFRPSQMEHVDPEKIRWKWRRIRNGSSQPSKASW